VRCDHVVIGAGSAGAVVAARLSEDPTVSVLLLEAGPDRSGADVEPGVASGTFFEALTTPGRLWPDLVATRTAGQVARPYARGRGIGGSSAVNALLAMRGIPADYDRWVALGAFGWGWRDVLPVFDALPVPQTTLPRQDWGAVDRARVAAAAVLGHPASADQHDGAPGWAPARLTLRDGRRASVAEAYLDPARRRPNLVIRGDALVDRVLIEPRGGRPTAVGVALVGGEVIEAASVVVSAGAIHSPAVLLRSGIDRPGVGRNLADHPACRLVLVLREEAAEQRVGASALSTVLRWSSGLAELDLQALPMNLVGADADGRAYGLLMGAVMQVHSRGTVRLASADPTVDPVVDLALLSDERDRIRLRMVLRELLRLADQPAVGAVAEAVVLDAFGTPAATLAEADDDAVDAWLAANLDDYVHAVGTCRMGVAADDEAVVDERARVIGVEALRVADASIAPDLPRANTHLTAVMIGERVVQLMHDETTARS